MFMKIRIQVVIEQDDHDSQTEIEEIACLERNPEQLQIEQLGLRLSEAKEVLAAVQTSLIKEQATQFLERHCCCPDCGAALKNGTHQLTVRTLFGTIKLASQRFHTCSCQREETSTRKSFSPLAHQLPERTTPEFGYLQAKWSSLMSYGLTSSLLSEVLPLSKRVSTAVLSRCVHRVAQRSDGELGEEQAAFIEGCPDQWSQLSLPGAPLVVGIDGGCVHAREGTNRKAGSFEVIVGKSMAPEGPSKRFGFVSDYDSKPKRRLYETLVAQGMQMNQQVTFLSDGDDTVRELQLYLNPQAEHLLDWFHIAMRLTVLSQMAKGIPVEHKGEKFEQELERVKWFLWHSNLYKALQLLEWLAVDIEEEASPEARKQARTLREFDHYIRTNQSSPIMAIATAIENPPLPLLQNPPSTRSLASVS